MKNFFKKIVPFLKEVKLEIRKVNWPSKQETIKYTLIVVGSSVTVAVFLGGLDYLFAIILRRFIL